MHSYNNEDYGTHQFIVYAVDVNILGRSVYTTVKPA